MDYRVIVLNGVSSSGKSSIARALQARLAEPRLTLGTDDLIDAMPSWMQDGIAGIAFEPDGRVRVGEEFARLEVAWMRGVAAMARAGAGVIVDDVWLGGAASQARWRAALGDLATLWVGVHCDPAVLAERERARGDRIVGMAADQLPLVHAGVAYDLEVDTTHRSPDECAGLIVTWLGEAAVSRSS